MSRNPDSQVAAMQRARARQTARNRAARPRIVAEVLALRNGGTVIAPEPDADSERMEAQNEGRLMPKHRPNFHE